MTDEEILRRLAEILENSNLRFWPVDPLHNDAQCLALVKKYDIEISRWKSMDAWYAKMYLRERPGLFVEEADRSLNRAICLAIIEAHK